MKLVGVYENKALAVNVLWRLLVEREPQQSISHKAMPTWEEHVDFVAGMPYAHWYIAKDVISPGRPSCAVGAVYLTHQREVGVAIFKAVQGQSYGLWAVDELMRLHPGRFLANINPANEASIALFRKLGFGGPIQITLEKS